MRLAILGAGGHGRVLAESAAAIGWTVSFFDDRQIGEVDGWTVSGKAADIIGALCDGVAVGIGDNRTRLNWIKQLSEQGFLVATIVDPSAIVSPSAHIDSGSFIARGAVVSTGAIIGRGCIVNTAASVDHDCRLADGVHLSPGVHLSGTVGIGECSWIGTGSSVRNNLNIGHNVIVGVGSAVVCDIGNSQVVAGVPARVLEKS